MILYALPPFPLAAVYLLRPLFWELVVVVRILDLSHLQSLLRWSRYGDDWFPVGFSWVIV